MILTAYLDESGTHAGSPATVMAGIMGHAKQWQRFEAEIRSLKRDYGFGVFHSKRFRAAQDEFKTWSGQKDRAFIAALGKSAASLIEAATCTLTNAAYDQFYRGDQTPRRVRLDSKYGLCFRYLLNHFALEAIRRFGSHKRFAKTRLHLVLEAGHKNTGDAERIFHELKQELRGTGSNLLQTITFAGKDDCNPLMIADYLAYGTLMLERADPQRILGRHDKETPPPLRYGTGMTELKFHRDGLIGMKSELVKRLRRGKAGRSTSPGETAPAPSAAGQPA